MHFSTIRSIRPKARAFTLVEVLIAMAIFGMAMAGVLAAFLSTVRTANATSVAVDFNSRSRAVQERLLFDLRAIGSITDVQHSGTASVDGNTLDVYREFTATIDEYGSAADAASVQVTYRFDDTKGAIIRIDPKHLSGVTVLSGITDAWFQFYRRKGTTSAALTNDMSQVTAIRVSFVPKKSGLHTPGGERPSSSALVQLRNPSFR